MEHVWRSGMTGGAMEVIDSQFHGIGPNFEWPESEELRCNVMAELGLGWMEAVGVDAAVLFPIEAMAWTDLAIKSFPERFSQVIRITEPAAPDVAEVVLEARRQPNVVAVRAMLGKQIADLTGGRGIGWLKSGALEPMWETCETHGIPVFMFVQGILPLIEDVAKEHPSLSLIIDHFGIQQPPMVGRDTPPWVTLPELLSLGKYENVAVKMCGAPVLSDEEYPFNDTWGPVHQIVDAFGAERVMWASDISRFNGRIGWENLYPQGHENYPGKHTYAESLHMIRDTPELSPAEKEMILGGSARRVLGWHSGVGAGRA
jgi:L-fuconolactonase